MDKKSMSGTSQEDSLEENQTKIVSREVLRKKRRNLLLFFVIVVSLLVGVYCIFLVIERQNNQTQNQQTKEKNEATESASLYKQDTLDCIEYKKEKDKSLNRFTSHIWFKYPKSTTLENVNADTKDNFCEMQFSYQGAKMSVEKNAYAAMIRDDRPFGIVGYSLFANLNEYTKIPGREDVDLVRVETKNEVASTIDFQYGRFIEDCSGIYDFSSPCKGDYFASDLLDVSYVSGTIPIDVSEEVKEEIYKVFDEIVVNIKTWDEGVK